MAIPEGRVQDVPGDELRVDPADPAVWERIAAAWPRRDYRLLHRVMEARDLPVAPIDRLFDAATLEHERPDPTSVLEIAFACRQEDSALVGLYVCACCLDAWERTGDHERIRGVLGALAERKSGDCLLDGIIELTLGIGDSMGVESGVFCSCPVETGTRARRVAETMEAVAANLELARPRDSVEDAVHDITRRFAAAQHLYFGSVASAAHAVEGLIDPDPRAPVDVGATITAMKDAEQSDLLAGDVYATELRAHRATLDALHRAQAQKSLHIDRSVLVYVYPFALDRFEASRVDDLVNKRITMNVAGAEPVDVEAHALQLTDLWTNPDREASDLGYGGVSIELPSLELTTTAREQRRSRPAASRRPPENVLAFEVEIRLSRLGNHYVRISRTLEDATLHHVNQAFRRGSHSMGKETLAWAGGSWGQLTDYARDVIKALAEAIRSETSEDAEIKPIGDPKANFHIALAVREASLPDPDSEERPATITDLTSSVGASLLFRPVLGYATALEEWVRYPRPPIRNLMRRAGFEGELVVRTSNTTVLFMPESPEWRIAGYQEMIEFVASLPPLLILWDRQAIARGKGLNDKFPTEAADERDVDLRGLHHEEGKLRKFEGQVRQELGFIHSPALCRDSSQRTLLDALWKAAGLPLLEADLDRRLLYLSALQERVSTIAAAMAEDHRRRARESAAKHVQLQEDHASKTEVAVQLAGTILAIASLAELFSWAENRFGFDHWAWAVGEVVVLSIAVVGVLWLVQRYLKRSKALDSTEPLER